MYYHKCKNAKYQQIKRTSLSNISQNHDEMEIYCVLKPL